MKLYKTGQKIKACFTSQEMTSLALSNDLLTIINIAKNNLQKLDAVKILINNLAQKTANSKRHELFVAIFDLCQLFDNDCQFCFNLNERFNSESDQINTLDELEEFKIDPPDIIALYQNKFHEFELKRYREDLSSESLFDFINRKIIKHYSDHNCNYYIILQSKSFTELNLDIFEILHKKLKKLKINLGKIVFSLNNNSKEMLLICVFPELTFSRRPFETGSEQVKNILKKK